MTKPSTAGRVQLVRWRRNRPEGCKGATHELYGAMQAPPFYGSVSAKRVRDRNVVDATMKKCLVYSRAAHVFKSTLKPGRLDQPRRMKFLRLSNEYFQKLLTAFTEQQVDMGDMRTEIRFQIRSFAEIPGVFSRQFAKLWSLLDVLELDVRQVLRMQEATLEWARDNRLFVGRDTERVTQQQYATFNLVLNAFGVWNRFTRSALRPSALLDTLRAKLILTNVQVANVVVIDEDDVEMDGVGAADGSETESEDGQEAVIDVDADETESENDLEVPGTDAANNDVDGDQLYMEIFDNIVVTQSGQFVVCRDHLGEIVTRQRSRARIAEVVLERFGTVWADTVQNTL
ncbi:hypothetical protein DVH05_007818 [Phytophthora capsici]|nr:hypothetical protein DVH05_007818 [Phytophthora capsici]